MECLVVAFKSQLRPLGVDVEKADFFGGEPKHTRPFVLWLPK